MIERVKFRLNEVQAAVRDRGVIYGISALKTRIRSDVYGASRRLYAHLFASEGMVLLEIQGSKMYLRLDDPGLSRDLIRNTIRERAQTQLIQEEVEAGMVGVDIGANLGYYACMEARLVGPTGRVLAIEPLPANVEVLEKNIAVNSYENVQVFQLAIGEETGFSDMWVTHQSNLGNLLNKEDGSISPLIRATHMGNAAKGQIRVSTKTLDDFLEEQGIPTVDFIRMDIEGYELNATKGMMRTFERVSGPLKLFIEVHNAHFGDPSTTVEEWLRALISMGFMPKALAVRGAFDGIVRDLSVEGFPRQVCSYSAYCPHVLLEKR